MRYDLTDFEWSVIQPLIPDKSCGIPPAPLVIEIVFLSCLLTICKTQSALAIAPVL